MPYKNKLYNNSPIGSPQEEEEWIIIPKEILSLCKNFDYYH